MKTNNYLISVSAALALTAVSCSSAHAGSEASVEPQKSHAIFGSFTYEGNDDFYKANPLKSENEFYNPVLPGWYSDPSVCTNGKGDYYLVTSTFTYYPGVPVFHSRDLMNWEQIGYVLSRPSQLQNLEKQHVSGGIFAPAIAYNPANQTYYMITTNVGAGNFFVKTKDPAGEWSDPIMLPQVQGIDPAFFFDEDGKGYIVNNDDAPNNAPEYDGHRTVRVVEFDPATDKCVGERKIIVNKGCRPEEKPIWCEGPHIYKINGKYFLMTAEGGTSLGHSEVIYRGDSPMGPYTPWDGNPILTQRTLDNSRENPITCAGHADLVQGPDGQWWSVFLACRPLENNMENLGRETFMLPVKWTDDGWPYMTREGEVIPMVVSNPGAVRGENPTFGNFAQTDEFADSTLPLHWFTLRGPATDYYSLTQNPGFLTIKCADVNSTEKAVLPFVARRINHHKYTATTDLTFVPENETQCAGMLLFKDETNQYFLGKDLKADKQRVVLRKITDNGPIEMIATELPDGNKTLGLRIVSNGMTLDFQYSADGGQTWENLSRGQDAGFLSTAKAGGFTGTTLGLYASNAK